MGMSTNDMSRRGFMTAAAGTAAAGAAAGTAAAQQEIPDFGPYLADANLFDDNVADNRDADEVTVSVGAGPNGVSFDPPTIWVSPGTTIIWEWTGEGGGHNVVPEEGPAGFEHSEIISEEGATYEYEVTEEDAGITTYKCIPHEGQGMKGGVAVGDDVETVEVGGGGGGPPIQIPSQAYSLTMATFIAMVTTLGLGYFFMKYGGDYETQ
jgi:halocyanin-like protein